MREARTKSGEKKLHAEMKAWMRQSPAVGVMVGLIDRTEPGRAEAQVDGLNISTIDLMLMAATCLAQAHRAINEHWQSALSAPERDSMWQQDQAIIAALRALGFAPDIEGVQVGHG